MLNRRLKSAVERTFGVTISRTRGLAANKHADSALLRIRRWSPGDVVFDVGANDGRTVLRIYDPLNRPHVYAFEPVKATYETLVRRTSHLGNVRCFRAALGSSEGRRTIYLNKIDAMNSLSRDWGQVEGSELVSIRTVDSIMEEEEVQFIHFLKIDVEGHDFEVLKGAHRALSSSRVAIVQVEVGVDQLDKMQPSLEQVRQYLAPMGYYLYGFYNQCHKRADFPPAWDERRRESYRPAVLAYFDALFVHGAI